MNSGKLSLPPFLQNTLERISLTKLDENIHSDKKRTMQARNDAVKESEIYCLIF